MGLFPPLAVERAMKVQEVILRAANRQITWMAAARIIGISDRTMRRMKWRYENFGCDGLLDKRRGLPSPKRAPLSDVEKILTLYREKYDGFNARHFRKKLVEEHKMQWSYTLVKKVLQGAGLIRKYKKRGRHHKRREPKACFGEMLHIDGSKHEWLALTPTEKQILIVVMDDATSRLLYAQLWPGETIEAVMTALRAVVAEHGVPLSLYNDRAGWAFYTPKAGEKVSKTDLTQVGRVLDELGVDHIPAYSPQARGRSERMNKTLQDRLVNELKAAGIRDVAEANRFIREVYIPDHNKEFGRTAKDPTSCFISAKMLKLDDIFCVTEDRVVSNDNIVRYDNRHLQIEKQRDRATYAGLKVEVRAHLDGTFSIVRGVRVIGHYNQEGKLIVPDNKTKTPETKVA
jgi:transposase